ncbi:polysaccharide biosynthesis/export family protein [bacterium]|nr:polysaccharide biosynthesis/export family protein [bacterium]
MSKTVLATILLVLCLCIAILNGYSYASREDVYRVGPADVLEISVWGEPDLSRTIPVSSDGIINFPMLGNLGVAGMTVKDIEQKITGLLSKDYLVDPHVYVIVKEYKSQKVIALGEVKNPGPYVLTGITTLLELISKAGGVTERIGKRILVFRGVQEDDLRPILKDSGYAGKRNGGTNGVKGVPMKGGLAQISEEMVAANKPVVIDVNRLMRDGSLEENITIEPGDVVFFEGKKDININEQQVYISGRIKKPGAYEYQDGLTALNLCIIAGGFDRTSAPGRATINRKIDGQVVVYKVDLNKVADGRTEDMLLMPGDRLNIPESFW